MEKYGTKNEDLLKDLLQEEAKLMTEMQGALAKKASADGTLYEELARKIGRVRAKITELETNI